jgi:hypothetical protein
VRAPGWDSVAFKGGSSLGVLTGSWLLEKDGDTYAAVIQTSTEAPAGLGAQEEQFTRLSEAAISLLAGSLS